MVDLKTIKKMYFIGIGGIGMSALARYFARRGCMVSGYDKTETTLTDSLMHENIQVHYKEDISKIPFDVDLVVYTPAIPEDHAEFRYFKQNHYQVVKRADLLEEVTKNVFTIAVAGAHGKTTTTSMIAHILIQSGYGCTAFLGGIAANYESNVLNDNPNTMVVEADEYDRSFLKLHPDIAVVTSSDPDHLDIYGNEEEIEKAYAGFVLNIKPNGFLLTKPSLSFLKYVQNKKTEYYNISNATNYADSLKLIGGTYQFDFISAETKITEIHLSVAGKYNVENAVAAVTVALSLGIAPEKIKTAIQSFRGVHRRFEFIYRNDKVVFIDDYAHHPGEIAAFMNSLREIFPQKKITCIFQPHLYTRTHDFREGFIQSLSLADEVILLPIYPAREKPIEGVSSEILLQEISSPEKMLCKKEELIEVLKNKRMEVLATVGAGDIDQLVLPIKKMLMEKYRNS